MQLINKIKFVSLDYKTNTTLMAVEVEESFNNSSNVFVKSGIMKEAPDNQG
jgi:hypothetical protein